MGLLVVDYNNIFPYTQKCSAPKDLISALNFCFFFFKPGISEDICDNSTQFISREYKEFAIQCGFTLTTSGLHYRRGDGFIKRQVQIITKLFKICDEDDCSYQMALCEFRVSPLTVWCQDHQESLYTTGSWNNSPSHHQASTPHWSSQSITSHQARLHWYETHAKEKSELFPIQPIWAQVTSGGRWSHPTICGASTTRWIQEKQGTTEEVAIPTKVPANTTSTASSTTVQSVSVPL